MQPSDRQDDDFIEHGFREQTIAQNFFFGIWWLTKISNLALRILFVISFLRDLYYKVQSSELARLLCFPEVTLSSLDIPPVIQGV